MDLRWWLDLLPATRGYVNTIGRNLMATVEEYAARVDAATDEVAADLKGVRDELAAVKGQLDGAGQAAVDAALARLDGPISRLEALGHEDDVTEPSPVEPGDGTTPAV